MSTEQAELAAVRDDVIARGARLYRERLKADPMYEHLVRFAAIYPDTGRYLLGVIAKVNVGQGQGRIDFISIPTGYKSVPVAQQMITSPRRS